MLEEVLALFCERYGLQEPDDSPGVRAIQGAMRGKVPIAELRNVLTTKYNLYPHYEERVLAILSSLEAAPETASTEFTVEGAASEESMPPTPPLAGAAPKPARRTQR